MKKVLLLILIGIVLVSFTSGYRDHIQNTDFNLTIDSNNATACNLSYIDYSDGTSKIFNIPLNKNILTFNKEIDSSNFTQEGDICMNIICTDGSTYETGDICRTVTSAGNTKDTGEMLNILGFLALAFAMAFLLYTKISRIFGAIIIFVMGIGIMRLAGNMGWVGIIVMITGLVMIVFLAFQPMNRKLPRKRRY